MRIFPRTADLITSTIWTVHLNRTIHLCNLFNNDLRE